MSNRYSMKKIKTNVDRSNFVNKPKHYPPLVKEWFNSIYVFNKDMLKFLPVLNKNLSILVNSYFNLYNTSFNKKTKNKRLRIKERNFSTNKLLISEPNVKHTSDKLNITVYTYNRRKKYYINKIANSVNTTYGMLDLIEKEKFAIFFENMRKNISDLEVKVEKVFNEKLKKLKEKLEKKEITSILSEHDMSLPNHFKKPYVIDFLKKHMRKEIVLIRYKQSISFEESKSENQYLLPLIDIIERIYNKKIGFNIVNLKYFYNSGSIFTKALTTKLKNRKNKPTPILMSSLASFNLPPLEKFTAYDKMYKKNKVMQNLSVVNLVSNNIRDNVTDDIAYDISYNKDALDHSLGFHHDTYKKSNTPETGLTEVINSLKNKNITGVRVEVAGRLTKRNTAERSLFKLKYKGSIKDSDSSYKKLSTVLLRGYSKANLMYNQSESKLRVGAFGLKTWINSN